jgi:hypothetical protein
MQGEARLRGLERIIYSKDHHFGRRVRSVMLIAVAT